MADYVQLLNPMAKRYVKVDKELGRIVSHKKTEGPFKGIPIVGGEGSSFVEELKILVGVKDEVSGDDPVPESLRVFKDKPVKKDPPFVLRTSFDFTYDCHHIGVIGHCMKCYHKARKG